MKKLDATRLAERIATDLFTPGHGKRKATRLQLKHPAVGDFPPPDTHGEIDLGGLCYSACVGIVRKILEESAAD